MAAPTILTIETSGKAMNQWQLCQPLVTIAAPQVALTAANLTTNFRDLDPAVSFSVLPVEPFTGLCLQVWGTGADTNTVTVPTYGFEDDGTGVQIGVITATMSVFRSAATTGFHASANTHSSIRNAFAAATAYRGCDLYVATNNYDVEMTASTQKADYPGNIQISLATGQYKYFAALVTGGTATTAGVIFKPLGVKTNFYHSPSGF